MGFDDWFSEAVQGVSNTVTGVAEDIGGGIQSAVDSTGDFIENTAEDIEGAFEQAGEAVSDAISQVEDFAEEVASDIEDTVSEVGDEIQKGLDEVGEGIGSAVKSTEEFVENIAEDIQDSLEEAGEAVKDAAKDVGDFVEERIDDIEEGAAAAGATIKKTAEQAGDLIERGLEAANKYLKGEKTQPPSYAGVFVAAMEQLTAGPTATQSSPDRQSRVECNTGQYDQVLAISENMLNAQLENYFDIEPKMWTMKQNDMFCGDIDAVMLPPRVSFPCGANQNRSSLDYHVRIESATISTYSVKPSAVRGGMKKQTWKIKDWEFVFNVNIAMQNMSEKDKAVLGPALGVAGEYSIQRLLLQFSTANLSHWVKAKSRTKMMNGGDPPESIAEKLDVWTRGWLADAGDIENRLHGQTILTTESVDEEIGDVTTTRETVRTDTPILYHAMPPESKDVNLLAPTFPPQAMTQQMYRFQRPDPAKPGEVQRFESKLDPKTNLEQQITNFNCLLYLETCGRDLPSSLFFDESHGNFVTADGVDMNWYPEDLTPQILKTPQIAGSMCFRGSILFDSFLIPRFRPLVKESQIWVASVTCDAKVSDNSVAFKWAYAFGGSTEHPTVDDPYYNMTRQGGEDTISKNWFNNNVPGIENKNGWRWVMNEMERHDESWDDGPKFFAKHITFNLHARSLCNLQHFPGTNLVRFTGITTMAMDFIDDRNCWFNADRDQVAITGVWGFDLRFSCGENGRVEIDVQWPDNPMKDEKNWVDPHGDHLRGISTSNIKEELQLALKTKVSGLKAHVQQIKDALKDQCFVLSGGGYFFQRNPIFTENGDLLVELEYKGIPPDGKLKNPNPLGVIPQPDNLLPKDINVPDRPVLKSFDIPAEPEKPKETKSDPNANKNEGDKKTQAIDPPADKSGEETGKDTKEPFSSTEDSRTGERKAA